MRAFSPHHPVMVMVVVLRVREGWREKLAEQLVVVDDSAAALNAAIFHPSLYAAAVLNKIKVNTVL